MQRIEFARLGFTTRLSRDIVVKRVATFLQDHSNRLRHARSREHLDREKVVLPQVLDVELPTTNADKHGLCGSCR